MPFRDLFLFDPQNLNLKSDYECHPVEASMRPRSAPTSLTKSAGVPCANFLDGFEDRSRPLRELNIVNFRLEPGGRRKPDAGRRVRVFP